jgi:hypothetical protein
MIKKYKEYSIHRFNLLSTTTQQFYCSIFVLYEWLGVKNILD